MLHASLDMNRIDRETLMTLLSAMKDSFPIFRRYFKSKAKKLGKDNSRSGTCSRRSGPEKAFYSWSECAELCPSSSSDGSRPISPIWRGRRSITTGSMRKRRRREARRRVLHGRAGGRGIAILTNFDGSFHQLTTVAHELGHAYHNHCQRGLPMMRRGAPMALAETASIFCETIVFNAALEMATPEQQLPILENQLIGATQVIVDIYSRFLFESEVIKRRENGDMPADEMSEIMIDAQKQTYGDGLDENHLHPYCGYLNLTTISPIKHFYNFPYAFGLLRARHVRDLSQRRRILRAEIQGTPALDGRGESHVARGTVWDRREIEEVLGKIVWR